MRVLEKKPVLLYCHFSLIHIWDYYIVTFFFQKEDPKTVESLKEEIARLEKQLYAFSMCSCLVWYIMLICALLMYINLLYCRWLLGKDLAELNLEGLHQLEQQLNESLFSVKEKKVILILLSSLPCSLLFCYLVLDLFSIIKYD